ncbi:hypothetical protein BLNAU_16394 [Blattamonas nauphoetae]|uniref:Uncharacterized protein n=1 Tax=Blattamonas nauphoetae TaxID=2049346 RepID=A0ABQ9X8B4_9EUKA|nr:hypothetical protein BLNAU_16394 [Blattamonas nauphoetae]
MISFDFSSDSISMECELHFGEWELRQYEGNYSVVAFEKKESIVDTNSAVLATPNPPRIVRAACEGGNSEFDAFFSLKARTLAKRSFKVDMPLTQLESVIFSDCCSKTDLGHDVVFGGELESVEDIQQHCHPITATPRPSCLSIPNGECCTGHTITDRECLCLVSCSTAIGSKEGSCLVDLSRWRAPASFRGMSRCDCVAGCDVGVADQLLPLPPIPNMTHPTLNVDG